MKISISSDIQWRAKVRPAALALALALSGAAHARAPEFPLLSEPRVQWSEPMSVQVWGMTMHYARFRAAWPVEKTAAELSSDSARFQAFTQMPDGLLLSGQGANGQHWVAQLAADGAGSRGTVSVLMTPESPAAPSAKGELASLFQGSDLWRVLLHVRQDHDGRTVEQAVYQGAAQAPLMLADMERRLRQAGWEPAGAARPGAGSWQRGRQRLRWQQGERGGQITFFMHYSE
jgi:hypothetical protein